VVNGTGSKVRSLLRVEHISNQTKNKEGYKFTFSLLSHFHFLPFSI
jgi:hypothetical protein